MTTKVNPIPAGYHTVTPYLMLKDAKKFIAFVEKAFNAKASFCMEKPDGTVGHTEIKIGDSYIMLSEACDEWGGSQAVTLHLYVEDSDKTYQQALAAGAKSIREVENQFYGDRSGGVQDEWGNSWWVSTHVEDVSPEEIQERAKKAGRC